MGWQVRIDGAGLLEAPPEHGVCFFDSDAGLVSGVAAHLASALLTGGSAIAIVTPPHLAALEAELEGQGCDLTALRRSGTWTALSARELVDALRPAGVVDADCFDELIGDRVRQALDHGARRLHLFGEMVSLLWQAGEIDGALALEDLGGKLMAGGAASLMCGYLGVASSDPHRASILARHNAEVHGGAPLDVRPPAGRDSRLQVFRPVSKAPTEARHFATETLAEWGLEQLREVAEVVVSELAANVVMHTASQFAVAVSRNDGHVRLAVRDASTDVPLRRRPDIYGEDGGRGLMLVTALSDRWGTEVLGDGGKIVWAELAM